MKHDKFLCSIIIRCVLVLLIVPYDLSILVFSVGVMVRDIFQELRLDVPSIEKHITPNMLCLRDLEVMLLI